MNEQLLQAAAARVAENRRDERALDRLLARGRFGPSAADRPWPAADRPWPGHDAALAREISRDMEKTWVQAITCLLGALT